MERTEFTADDRERIDEPEIEREAPLRVVGSGPFPLPGERRRHQKAADEARRMLDNLPKD